MATGDLLVDAFQIELRETLFDACDSDATLIVAQWLDGFGGPDTRNADTPRQAGHGLVPSRQWLDGRYMSVGIGVQGATPAAVRAGVVDLASAWQPVDPDDADLTVDLAFTFDDPALRYVVHGKPLRSPGRYDALLRTWRSQQPFIEAWLCEWLATDPAIYSLDVESASATPGATSGGLGFPHGFPHGFGTATPGSAVCVNDGNFPTWPTVVFTAGGSGLVNPSVTLNETGEVLALIITLSAGDTLTVDMEAGTVLLNGTASRIDNVNWNTSDWFDLNPGVNTLAFGGTGAGSTMDVTWQSAWLL